MTIPDTCAQPAKFEISEPALFLRPMLRDPQHRINTTGFGVWQNLDIPAASKGRGYYVRQSHFVTSFEIFLRLGETFGLFRR
ncbi:hypothetical protein [Bradyrhizobium sp. Ec3.3]|uniref:hypothetical protein n=1 Tax=Bradyrhizobium sp. Ec3.3 TaxID=189753 RepID=UPI000482EA2B|nr:hypothetical protein [Bradyrhizobium sp. Ec3.3]